VKRLGFWAAGWLNVAASAAPTEGVTAGGGTHPPSSVRAAWRRPGSRCQYLAGTQRSEGEAADRHERMKGRQP